MSAPPRPRLSLLLAVAGLLAIAAALLVAPRGGTGHRATVDAARTAAALPPTGCLHRRGTTVQLRRGNGPAKRVALTFDDGPAALTPSVLALLEREHVRATFFVVGRNVAGREALLRRALAGGSMIGNHSFTHVSLAGADETALSQIADTQAAIRSATGFTPCLLRPPFGLSSKALVAAADARGLTSVLWSVNPQDFTTPGTAAIRRRVLAGVRPGSIVLMHDGGGDRRQTLAALPSIIRTLRARGYRFVTVTELAGLASTRR